MSIEKRTSDKPAELELILLELIMDVRSIVRGKKPDFRITETRLDKIVDMLENVNFADVKQKI